MQIGAELPEMHNTSCELHNAYDDVVKVRFVEIKYMEYLFNDVLEIKNGKNQKLVENPEGLYPIYGSGGIIGYADKYICEANTVIIGRKGSINNPIYVSEPFWNVDTAFGLSPKQDILLPRYLFYFCKNYNFEKLNKTVTIPSLTKADLLKIQIDLPSIDEQRRIVDKLIKVETIINLRNYQVQQLDDLIKARFVEMFGDPKLNDRGWNSGIISDYYEVKGGKRIPKGMGYADGITAHPYLRATDMKNETILDDDIHYIDDDVFERIKRYTVKGGDIYLTNVGVNLGMAGVIPEKYDGANLTENAVKLVPKTEKVIDGVFLAYYINSPGIQDYINERKMSVGVPKLAIFRIETMPLLLPPIELQMKFIEFVNQIDKSKLLSGCRLFHSWAPENRDKPKHVGVPRRRTKDLRGGRRQQ